MKRIIIFHPILLALFPVLFLYSCNLQVMPFHEVLRSSVFATSMVFLLWLVTFKCVQNGRKAGLIVSLFLFFFLTYGYALVIASPAGSLLRWREPLRHMGVQLLLLVLFVRTSYLVWRSNRSFAKITNLANFASVCLVSLSLIQDAIAPWTAHTRAVQTQAALRPTSVKPLPHRPHIYYIILDEYARGDVLHDYFHFNNADFLDYLVHKGFYIAEESHANYCHTYQSLASSLNFSYLDQLANSVGPESTDRLPLGKMIRDNRVADFLRSRGYRFIAFSSGISLTEIDDSDVYVNPPWELNQFEYTLLLTTPLGQLSYLSQFQIELHRQRLLYTFDHLADFAASKTPVFVFAHILAPHAPFVFGADGQRVRAPADETLNSGFRFSGERETYRREYCAQLGFVSSKIKRTIDSILSQSPEPPVILLQSDHGSGSKFDRESLLNTDLRERMSILNAYYFPGKGTQGLYPGITPVNTFRTLFNEYFGTQLRLLEDRSYFVPWSHPYEFVDVSNRLDKRGQQ